MTTTCIECGHEFSDRDALCEDWRDPNKSFGCPRCHTFYKKEMRPQYRKSLISGILSAGIALPAVMMVGHYFSSGDVMNLFYGGVIFFSCLAILLILATDKELTQYKLERVEQD